MLLVSGIDFGPATFRPIGIVVAEMFPVGVIVIRVSPEGFTRPKALNGVVLFIDGVHGFHLFRRDGLFVQGFDVEVKGTAHVVLLCWCIIPGGSGLLLAVSKVGNIFGSLLKRGC